SFHPRRGGARAPPDRPTRRSSDLRIFHEAGTDVNVVALVHHMQEVRGGSALHYAVRKRYKEVIKQLAGYGIDMDARDQDGLTARSEEHTSELQSRDKLVCRLLPEK